MGFGMASKTISYIKKFKLWYKKRRCLLADISFV